MARKPQIPKRVTERSRSVLAYSLRNEPRYGRPNPFLAYLLLLIGLAVAGLIVYYVLNHREQFAGLWQKATHPPPPAEQTIPNQ